jgi:hypothetical protein
MRYFITAINSLTGEREPISNPLPLMKARVALKRMQAALRNRRSGGKPPWTLPKLEEAVSEGELFS